MFKTSLRFFLQRELFRVWFYTELIIYNYTTNQTINIEYTFYLFKMDTNKVLMPPAFLMVSRYTSP
ncbi:hypothetical protein DMN57_12465 [Escherichia coli]|nr:hypothetical protein [Escherichia coli]